MKKLFCDICNSDLEMKSDGQGAVCKSCGMTYPTARLREMLNSQQTVQQSDECVATDTDISVSENETLKGASDCWFAATYNKPKPFVMLIEDAFEIKGRGMVVTGYVDSAPVNRGDVVGIIRMNGMHLAAKVMGIESNKTLLDSANPGEAVGILLDGVNPGQVFSGDVLTSLGSPIQSVTDYYLPIRCSGCGSVIRAIKPIRIHAVNCPSCNSVVKIL